MSMRTLHDTWKLLQPELLSVEELITVLREKQVDLDEGACLEKAKLVEIFKRVAMPQAQRARFKAKRPQDKDFDSSLVTMASPERDGRALSQQQPSVAVQSRKVEHISDSLARVNLKRPSSGVSDSTPGPSLKKREKITWP